MLGVVSPEARVAQDETVAGGGPLRFLKRQLVGGAVEQRHDHLGVLHFGNLESEERHRAGNPSGLLPCYLRRGGSVTFLASDMTELIALGTATVDFDVITRMFASIDALGRKTAIAGVDELLPGERLRLDSVGMRIGPAWSPWQHMPHRYRRSFDEDVATLRATVKQSVGAWATYFDSILLGVSGGVDSSIVAAAAISRTPGLRLLTLVEPGSEGDERRYAEALAHKLGLGLATPPLDLGEVDVTQPSLPHMPVPIASPLFQAIAAIHRKEEREKPIDAFFSGSGGDNIFCNMYSAAPLADRFTARGPTPGVLRRRNAAWAQVQARSRWPLIPLAAASPPSINPLRGPHASLGPRLRSR